MSSIIVARRNMSTISDVQLDRAILALKRRFLNSGYQMMTSLMRTNDQIIVPKARSALFDGANRSSRHGKAASSCPSAPKPN